MDFSIENHSSIVLLVPQTEAARTWVAEHLLPDATWGRIAIALQPRLKADMIDALISAGLEVDLG